MWKPGESGNLKGRPPGIRVRELAKQHTEAAIQTLVDALKSPRERVTAAIALLDRGWGKPKELVEAINLNFDGDGSGIDCPALPEDLDTWLARRRSELKDPVH